MPVPHHSVFTGRMPCHPTNSVKALKASTWHNIWSFHRSSS